MIQIRTENLDALANEHCENIKSQFKLDKKLRKKANEDNKNKEIWDFLADNIDDILKGKSEILMRIISKWTDYISKNKSNEKDLKEAVTEIFYEKGYKTFTTKNGKKYDAYNLANKLNIDVCPYCNRQYTHTLSYSIVDDKGNEVDVDRVRPDLDHFAPKSIYPYLALSFYNLIPSCLPCNQRLKRDVDFRFDTHVYPYNEGFKSEVRFNLKIKDIGFFKGKVSKENAEIKLDFGKLIDSKEKRNSEVFELENLYNFHLDYVHELMNKAIIYNDDYLLSLSKQLGANFTDKKDIALFISSNYVGDDELHLRPLSKLTKDMLEQFGH
jgi:hypothetical protein